MMLQYRLIIEQDSTLRDELLKKYNISRREYRRIKAYGEVYVNGTLQRATVPLKKGELVEIKIQQENNIIPQTMELDIIYEDQYLLLINKPADILVHPVHSERTNTLANGIKSYFDTKGDKSGIHPIHRLDRETSGLVLFAKSSYIHNKMAEQLIQRSIKREYLALVDGRPKNKQGVINFPILDTPVKKRVDEKGKEAITQYQVLKFFENNALLRLKLLTGRTHQIRIHLKALGHGIMGDRLYNGGSNLILRQALHAFRMEFIHPISLKDMVFISKLPGDFVDTLKSLKNFESGEEK